MSSEALAREIDKLTLAEKLVLVTHLWDDIAQSNEELPLPQWQKDELDQRLALYEQGKVATKSWQQINDSLSAKYL